MSVSASWDAGFNSTRNLSAFDKASNDQYSGAVAEVKFEAPYVNVHVAK